MIFMFLQDFPNKMKELRKAIDEKDDQRVILTAHSIKGNAVIIIANGVSDLAGKIEMSAKSGDMETAAEHYPFLEEAFGQLKAEVAKFRKNTEA